MSDITERPDDNPRRRRVSPVAIVLLLVLYPLSIGPVAWVLALLGALRADHLAARFFYVFYFPLIWLAEHSSVVESLLIWYGKLFGLR